LAIVDCAAVTIFTFFNHHVAASASHLELEKERLAKLTRVAFEVAQKIQNIKLALLKMGS